MKVLDLRCANDHRFEGWFDSDADLQSQRERGLLTCPVCGHTEVERLPSAPRLNLSSSRSEAAQRGGAAKTAEGEGGVPVPLQQLYLKAVRHILANTEDVGERFAEEARRMHYQEAPERGIRGTTSHEEALELADEGIEVMPLLVPDALKQPVH
ncbi:MULTISPECIES: DUF1178 family protein [Ralstonia solanacearum species complex]|uniref:DUF1178 domain-containing protein n=2 Tax=Ralstonia solanacearum TaxID=305 RepID=A0ABF7RB47_RALSL|nr:DUF1178 family protein [Ralstonia solanacearum]ALF88679.1 hypothetical protein RSUY_23540 [Ralstonia solanacearum]ATI28119.1 hypothetical protein CCY86_11785 [Ralstonia solanacearum]EAP74188.1 Hypothetical Protein RRSL_03906 [Ralstonia solanacearum UW551]KEI32306.1 hypothetical protein CQ06_17835 [Ralstonia solanacearum]KFX79532.1 hypothetical protein KR98_08195 [Ralstonia solanacearum]